MAVNRIPMQKSRVSHVVHDLPPSGIREFFDLVQAMDDVTSLGVGEPDFVTPWTICESAIYALERGRTSYTSNWGLLELRREIAAYLGRGFGAHYNPETDGCEILPTVGVSQGYDIILRAILEPGDEVIIHQPSYVAYTPMVRLAGGVPVILETTAAEEFKITPKAVRALITERTKAIVINYPCNPTGATMDEQALREIAELARDEQILILSDEVYAELTYDRQHVSMAAIPTARDNCVLMSGMSKAWAMTGWRMGYLAGPHDLIAAACKIHQYSMLSCPILTQYAAIEALRNGDKAMRDMVDTYNQRRRVITEGLNQIGLTCHMPEGAFYAFPSIKKTGMSSAEFCKRLLQEHKVAVVPGTAFGPSGEGHVRIAYAASFDAIDKALEAMGTMVG